MHEASTPPITAEARGVVNDLDEIHCDAPEGEGATDEHRRCWADLQRLIGLCKGLITAVDALAASDRRVTVHVMQPAPARDEKV